MSVTKLKKNFFFKNWKTTIICFYDSKIILFINNTYLKCHTMFVDEYYLCGTKRSWNIIVRVKLLNIQKQEISFSYIMMHSHKYTTALQFLAKKQVYNKSSTKWTWFFTMYLFVFPEYKNSLKRYVLKNRHQASIKDYCKNRFSKVVWNPNWLT